MSQARFVSVVPLWLLLAACTSSESAHGFRGSDHAFRIARTEQHFDSAFRIEVVAQSEEKAQWLAALAFVEIGHLEMLWTHDEPLPEVVAATGDLENASLEMPISDDSKWLIACARDLSSQTDGAFDASNLDAIVRAYAIDVALMMLSNFGALAGLVEADGSARAFSDIEHLRGWQVPLPSLDPREAETLDLELAVASVAEGHSAQESRRATVIAYDALTARALAEAVLTLGAEEAVALIERTPEAKARIEWRGKDGIQSRCSNGFGKLIPRQ